MREIEVKAKIKNIKEVKERLLKLGCKFSKPALQKDRILYKKGEKINGERLNRNVFRIREQEGKTILTLKIKQKNELDCIEREVIINDAKQMIDILGFLDYVELLKLEKTRTKCKYNGYEICIDEVGELGNFIEVEKMSDEDAEKVQARIIEFLTSLGIDKNNIIIKGYDTLMAEKQALD